ncbi:MAG: penicillin acylase family protein [bacterium]|nr:penicillin acylase family protein [bacterium]
MHRIFFVVAILALTAFSQDTQTVKGLKEKVSVARDSYSRTYISAANEADLYFVQGYVTASDRLWQMDMLRRVARGETAELSGARTLEEDKRWRRLGFAKTVEGSIQFLDPALGAALESYAAGVNAYIASLNDQTLPVEFRILQYKPKEWKPSDSLIIGKILADALSSTWRQDLLKASLQSALPKQKFDELADVRHDQDVILFGKDVPMKNSAAAKAENRPVGRVSAVDDRLLVTAERVDKIREDSLARIGFYAEDLAASNNWVISGKRTADGKPILANDPHLAPNAPGIWYLSHLETPSMRVAGVTFPGVPGIVLGHNEHIAWGATNVGPDVQDLYLETVDADGKVRTPTGSEAAKVRTETINVRKSLLAPATEPVTIEVTETRNGPIIIEEGGKKYSLKWTAQDPQNNDFAAFFFLNRAKNWDEFKAALSTYRGATQNFVYADTKGNIGWHVAGAIPLRKTGDGSLPYVGATADGDWTGVVPFAELPNLYNPPSGFIMTANQRIAGTDYKYPQLTRDFATPWRARRLFDLLSADKKATPDSVGAAQFDSFNIPLANLSNEIVRAKAASDSTLSLLGSWDGKMSPDSRAALLANEIRGCLGNKIAEGSKPAPANVIRERILDRAIRERSPLWLPSEFNDYSALMKACDSESAAALEKRYGADRSAWIWGKVSAARLSHPLLSAPLIGGQFATPTEGLFGSGQTPNVASAVSMRLIATPGNWDSTRHSIPLGQSGDARSPHYKDQFEAYKTGNSLVYPFSREAVKSATVRTLVLNP